MRDTNLCPQTFCRDLERSLANDAREYSAQVLSRITPNDEGFFRWENDFVIKTRNKTDLICLSIFSYYCPPEVGILIRESIQEIYSKNEENFFVLNFLLQGKAEMLIFLQETSLWHTRDLYGNILTKNRIRNIFRFCEPRMNRKKSPKRVQRHRGYRDKGTRRDISEKHCFVNDNKGQQELEERRLVLADSIALVRGMFLAPG